MVPPGALVSGYVVLPVCGRYAGSLVIKFTQLDGVGAGKDSEVGEVVGGTLAEALDISIIEAVIESIKKTLSVRAAILFFSVFILFFSS